MTSCLLTMQRYDFFRYPTIISCIKVQNCVRNRLRTHYIQTID